MSSENKKSTSNWEPKGDGTHFIRLTLVTADGSTPVRTRRVRADRIDWLEEQGEIRSTHHTVVSVGGKEFRVAEPICEILPHIEDPALMYKSIDGMERPSPLKMSVAECNRLERLPSYVSDECPECG